MELSLIMIGPTVREFNQNKHKDRQRFIKYIFDDVPVYTYFYMHLKM